MNIHQRNNVNVIGEGATTMVFAHGFGCDQNMWRRLIPTFSDRFRIVLFDLVGCGQSDLSGYDREKYGSVHGYAADVLEIIGEVAEGPMIFVGHLVSAMIGLLAEIEAPDRFAAADHGRALAVIFQ